MSIHKKEKSFLHVECCFAFSVSSFLFRHWMNFHPFLLLTDSPYTYYGRIFSVYIASLSLIQVVLIYRCLLLDTQCSLVSLSHFRCVACMAFFRVVSNSPCSKRLFLSSKIFLFGLPVKMISSIQISQNLKCKCLYFIHFVMRVACFLFIRLLTVQYERS